METFRGMMALDIDGTITKEKYRLEKATNDYLNFLIEEKWLLVFVTGRTFAFAQPILSKIKGDFYCAVQNGAALYKMPILELIEKYYLKANVLPELDAIFEKEPGGLLVESGKEKEDVCFYKPKDFDEKEIEYIRFRIGISPEKWVAVDSFDELELGEFAVGKYFASEKKAEEIAKKIHQIPEAHFNVVVIRDPFRKEAHLAHINDRRASKGKILDKLSKSFPLIIAAGDDYNDIEMLERAQVKIVMEDAPKKLFAQADIIAKTAKKQGIIEALKEAIVWKDSSK